MQRNTPGMDRYFFEYAFYQMVEQVSPQLDAPITARQGRELRERLDENMRRSLGREISQLNMSNARDVANFFAMSDQMFGQMYNSTEKARSTRYQSLVPGLWTMRGKAQQGESINPAEDQFIGRTRQQFFSGVAMNTPNVTAMPVSPYDPRWAYREAVLENGTGLLRIPPEVVAEHSNNLDMLHAPAQVGTEKARQSLQHARRDAEGDYVNVGAIETVTDKSGLSALKPYLRTDEFEALRKAPNLQGKTIDDASLRNAVAIMEYLGKEGIEYRVQAGRGPGQIKLNVADSRSEIRLIDTDSPRYTGRVYNNGMQTYLMSNKHNDKNPAPPTQHEVVQLVAYGLGKNPVDDQGVQLGEHGRYAASENGDKFTIPLSDRFSIHSNAKNRKFRTKQYPDAESAERDLRSFVAGARASYDAQIDVDGLLKAFEEHGDDPDYMPELHGTTEIAELQLAYWNMLSSERDGEPIFMRDPGYSDEEYEAAVAAMREGDSEALTAMTTAARYDTAAERIRAHANLAVDDAIGTYDPNEEGLRFDAHMVASYMPSVENRRSNRDTIIEAAKTLGITADEFRGHAYDNLIIADRMITFDENTATPMAEHDDPFFRDVSQTITESLRGVGVSADEILIDDSGVVRWSGTRNLYNAKQKTNSERVVSGEIGQIFPRGERGEVVTKFAGSENVMFAPGYLARVVTQEPGQNLSLEDRSRLIGYEQLMHEAIREELHNSVIGRAASHPNPTGLNGVYRKIYGHRYPVDFFEKSLEQIENPQPGELEEKQEWDNTRIGAETARVLYSGDLRTGSTMMAYDRAKRDGIDVRNDNSRDPLVLSGFRNMSIIDPEASAGMYDPDMSGTASAHGVVRYLAEGVNVDRDGNVERVRDENGDYDKQAKNALMKHEYMRYASYDPHDRVIMTISNVLQSVGASSNRARAAFVPADGWTFEDGVVISKDFAERYRAVGANGEYRPLKAGDKISDFHGNKGVDAIVIDPDMPEDEIEDADLRKMVTLFKANPDLDIVMSPYSFISRFNLGTMREMMEDPASLFIPDENGELVEWENAMGTLNMMVTHLSVDKKTNMYDVDAEDGHGGRKISNQMAWNMAAHECEILQRELYAPNILGYQRFREYASMLGISVDEYANASDTLNLDGRTMFTLPDADELARGYKLQKGAIRGFDANKRGQIKDEETGQLIGTDPSLADDFAKKISRAGGVLALPFPIEMANGHETPSLGCDPETGEEMYGLIIPSSSIRAGQELRDGTVSEHDYTQHYMNIYRNACEIQALKQNPWTTKKDIRDVLGIDRGSGPNGELSEQEMDAFVKSRIDALQKECQHEYDTVANDVIDRNFEGKHNAIKEHIMGYRRPFSVTAVAQPDPRLDVDEIAIGPEMAKVLRVSEGDMVGFWRDPQLHPSNIAGMRITIRDDIEGFQMSPATAERFDGDFDGDTYGIVGNLSKEAQEELRLNASVTVNPLNTGAGRDKDGRLELGFGTGLDIQVARAQGVFDRDGKDYLDELKLRANAIHDDFTSGDYHSFITKYGSDEDVLEQVPQCMDVKVAELDQTQAKQLAREIRYVKNSQITDELSNCMRAGFQNTKNNMVLQFGSATQFMDSVKRMVDMGAKGSERKWKEMGRRAGFTYDEETGTWEDTHATGMTPEDFENSQYAMVAKDHYTGVAGKHSQHAVQYLRAQGLTEPATEASYVATQGLLQAKHSASDADKRVYLVDDVLRKQWSGNALTPSFDEERGYNRWDPVTYTNVDSNGNERTYIKQATADEWVQQMKGIIDDLDASVDTKHLEKIAYALSEPVINKEGYDTGERRMLNTRRWDTWPEAKQPTVIDQLAYDGKKEDLYRIAEEGRCLFDEHTSQFMPAKIRDNIALRDSQKQVDEIRKLSPEITDEQILQNYPDIDARALDPNIRAHSVDAKDTHAGQSRARRLSSPQEIDSALIAAMPKNEQPIGTVSEPITPNSMNTLPKQASQMTPQDIAAGLQAQYDREPVAVGGSYSSPGHVEEYNDALVLDDGYQLPDAPSEEPYEESDIDIARLLAQQEQDAAQPRRNYDGPQF